MAVGDTQWRMCTNCGRRFLAAVKTSHSMPHCPECRAEKTLQLVRAVTGKWLTNQQLKP